MHANCANEAHDDVCDNAGYTCAFHSGAADKQDLSRYMRWTCECGGPGDSDAYSPHRYVSLIGREQLPPALQALEGQLASVRYARTGAFVNSSSGQQAVERGACVDCRWGKWLACRLPYMDVDALPGAVRSVVERAR